VHGFAHDEMKRIASVPSIDYVCRGGFFGGHIKSMELVYSIYDELLYSSLKNGYMGTEESIFTLMSYMYPHLFTTHFIESNGLVYKFFEDMKKKEKVEKMILSIAYPDSFAVTPLPLVNPECLLETIFSLGIWKTDDDIRRLGTKRKQQKGWEDPIYAVNGYYYSEANELIIPAGSLLSPFYDESKPLGWNYGGVGVVMGHEITHAFDEEGKEYDPAGHRKSWWLPQDKKNYEEKTKQIIKVYSSQRIFGKPVDGKSTLSENIADLGGLAIALDALNLELEKRKSSLEERKQAYRQFFISYAVSWRVKEKKEKQIHALLVDRHAPTPLRVNLIVNQFQEWYDAFDVKEGDPMFVDPKKRLQIF
jgi:putative endopeptidase